MLKFHIEIGKVRPVLRAYLLTSRILPEIHLRDAI
jgi:hypothetical protein